MAWFDERFSGYDCESTGVDPEDDRIVQAAIVSVGGGEPTRKSVVLINPGVPIPEAASQVHGITDAIAQEQGVAAKGAIPALAKQITVAINAGRPIVIFNAPFDCTMLDRECRRHGCEPPDWSLAKIIDPLVIDRWADKFRRSYPYGHTPETAKAAGILSTRCLAGMCQVYAVELGEDAHDAAADALAAARLAWRMLHKGDLVQGRHPEIIARRTLWKRVRDDLDALQAFQAAQYREQSVGLRAWFEGKGMIEEAAGVREDWPCVPYRAEVEV